MKKISTTEFAKYISRMFYEAKLDLKNAKTIKDGKFNFEIHIITDIKIFQRKNGTICGKMYVDGKEYWYDYANIDDIRRFLKRKFENGVREEWWNLPKTDCYPGLKCAEIEGEWFNTKDKSIQKKWIYKRLITIVNNAYKKSIKYLN